MRIKVFILLGESFTTEAKEIPGYTLKTTPENATGTFTEEAQTVTYVYEAGVGAPVTVKYVNQHGAEIAARTTLTGRVGQSFTAVPKAPTGYDLVETPKNATGMFTTEEQTVTFQVQSSSK